MTTKKRQRAARKSEAACSTCRWWDSSPFDERFLGLCRRNPPSVMRLWDDEPDARDSWPETTPVDWCGEHTSNTNAYGRETAGKDA
jgi:hypothetical protein